MTERTELLKQLIEYTITIRASRVLSSAIIEAAAYQAGFSEKELKEFLKKNDIEDPEVSPNWIPFSRFVRAKYYKFPEGWGDIKKYKLFDR